MIQDLLDYVWVSDVGDDTHSSTTQRAQAIRVKLNTVAGNIVDFTVADRDIVGCHLDPVATLPLAVDKVVFVEAGFCDKQSFDASWISSAADLSLHPNRFFGFPFLCRRLSKDVLSSCQDQQHKDQVVPASRNVSSDVNYDPDHAQTPQEMIRRDKETCVSGVLLDRLQGPARDVGSNSIFADYHAITAGFLD